MAEVTANQRRVVLNVDISLTYTELSAFRQQMADLVALHCGPGHTDEYLVVMTVLQSIEANFA